MGIRGASSSFECGIDARLFWCNKKVDNQYPAAIFKNGIGRKLYRLVIRAIPRFRIHLFELFRSSCRKNFVGLPRNSFAPRISKDFPWNETPRRLKRKG